MSYKEFTNLLFDSGAIFGVAILATGLIGGLVSWLIISVFI